MALWIIIGRNQSTNGQHSVLITFDLRAHSATVVAKIIERAKWAVKVQAFLSSMDVCRLLVLRNWVMNFPSFSIHVRQLIQMPWIFVQTASPSRRPVTMLIHRSFVRSPQESPII
jgi:hypothetical protein